MTDLLDKYIKLVIISVVPMFKKVDRKIKHVR